MARIRTIKPEFPQSESIGRLSRDARLLFIQLWTIVDDAGRTRAASRMLASLLYPYDDDAPKLIGQWLDELEEANCIRRYEYEGSTYLDIPKWLDHQKIDRPSPSRLPQFDEHSAKPREHSRGLDADLGPSTKDLGPRTVDHSARSARNELFEEFWKSKPSRKGSNPKVPASKVFLAALKRGVAGEEIINAARKWASSDADKVGTEYVAQAVTWLRQERWRDYQETPEDRDKRERAEAFARTKGWEWDGERFVQTNAA